MPYDQILNIVNQHLPGCDPKQTLKQNCCDSLLATIIHADVEAYVNADVPSEWLVTYTIAEWAEKAAVLIDL